MWFLARLRSSPESIRRRGGDSRGNVPGNKIKETAVISV
jgi:hypothetical protein